MVGVYSFSYTTVMVAFLMGLFSESSALKCYITDKDTKETSVVENEEYAFCSLFPSVRDSRHFMTSISEGLLSEELDKPFQNFFDENDKVYSALSLCLLEKYDWPKIMSPKHISALKSPEVEYVLRCVCNTDLCNGPTSFSEHVKQFTNDE